MEIAPNDVHLWWLRTDGEFSPEVLDRCASLLSADEREREDRFVFKPDRISYRLSHAMLRQTLSLYAPVAPKDWVFESGPQGKPAIATDLPHLEFSLTHTSGLAACLISTDREVGVDAENINRPTEHIELAERFFSREEAEHLRRLPEEWRAEGFFAVWTLKEAYIKARGLGLQIPLGDFSFSFPEGLVKITFSPQLDDDATLWQFERFEPTADHRVAVAVRQLRLLPLKVISREVEL